jgi:hypothetical protein
MSVLGSFVIPSSGVFADPIALAGNNYFTGENTFVQPVSLNGFAGGNTEAMNIDDVNDLLADYARLTDPDVDYNHFTDTNIFKKNPTRVGDPVADDDLSNVNYLDNKFAVVAAAKVNQANLFTGVNDFQAGFIATTLTASDTVTYGTVFCEGPLQFNGNVNLTTCSFGGNILVNQNMKTNGIIRCSPYNSLGWSTELSNTDTLNCFANPCLSYLIYLTKTSAGTQTVNLPAGIMGQKITIIQRNASASANLVASGATPVFINKLTGIVVFTLAPQHCVTLMFLGPTNIPGIGARANTWMVITYI